MSSSFSFSSLILGTGLLLGVFQCGTSTDLKNDVKSEANRHRAECLMWSKLENKTLPLQNQGHAKCVTNKECTGFTCTGVYQNKDLTFGMRVLPCQETPGVEIYGYAPQFHAKNFTHVFTHKSQYVVPGALLNMSVLPGHVQNPFGKLVTGKLEVFLERNPANNTLILGLKAMGCINKTCIFEKPVFNHTEIPVPECPTKLDKRINSVCNVEDLFSCGENQMCVQNDDSSSKGTCQCQTGFAIDEDNKSCVSKEVIDNRTAESHRRPKSSDPHSSPHKSDGNAGSNGGAIAATVIGVLAIVVLSVGILGYVVVTRTRLAPRLRARITRKPYEDIIIGDRNTNEENENRTTGLSA